jgi:hypothetical protein
VASGGSYNAAKDGILVRNFSAFASLREISGAKEVFTPRRKGAKKAGSY